MMIKKTIIFCLSILYSCSGQNQNDIINGKNIEKTITVWDIQL
jgi:hypothetical protein